MKRKIISLLLLFPFLLTFIVFSVSKVIDLKVDVTPTHLILEHDSIELAPLSIKEYPLYAYLTPSLNEEVIFESSDNGIAKVEGNKAILLREGEVVISARDKASTLKDEFTLLVYDDVSSSMKEKIYVYDPTVNSSRIGDTFYYGRYDLSEDKKVDAKISLKVISLPLGNEEKVISEVISGSATIDSEYIVTLKGNEDVLINFYLESNKNVSAEYKISVIEEGVNIFSYSDLMKITNESKEGEVGVMRVSLESKEYAYKASSLSSKEFYKNTSIFGYNLSSKVDSFNLVKKESTYDVTFLNNLNKDSYVYVAIDLKKSLYGNGFTINLNDLCFPSLAKEENNYMYSEEDIFKGPLEFVSLGSGALSITVYGEDNIALLLDGDNIIVNDLKLTNTNEVNDLKALEYVGTTLENRGDNNKIINSSIRNGRNVIRSFSNKNFLIENSFIANSREFLVKVGSNEFVKPEEGKDLSSFSSLEKQDFLNPEPLDKEGINSSIEIKDSILYQSGFFSVGVDTHFSGEVLYGSSSFSFPGIKNMAGTSSGTSITLSGKTKIYDWKRVADIDSSSILKPSESAYDLLKSMFDIEKLINEYLKANPSKNLEIEYNGESYVHTGIAFYGGGKNYSSLTLKDNLNLDFEEIEEIYISGLPALCSGPYPFRFYLYSKDTSPNLFNEVPSLDLLKN